MRKQETHEISITTIEPYRRWFALLFAITLIVFFGFCIERLLFLKVAKHISGTVLEIVSRDGGCGRGIYSSKVCTHYKAKVSFRSSGNVHNTIIVDAGSSRGAGQPISKASIKMGQAVRVVYDPNDLNKTYEDTILSVWAVPIGIFIPLIMILNVHFFPRRKRWSLWNSN